LDVDTEIVWIGNKPIPGCIACNRCEETGVCAFNSGIYAKLRELLPSADGIVIGSPTYYAGPSGSLCALLDRLFYSCGYMLTNKPAAAVGICRRAGAIEVVDRINRYFDLMHMPIVTSQYWNIAFGLRPGDVKQDAEGMQTMRVLGQNMAWLLKSIEKEEKPKYEEHIWTHFIR
jgi:multimeric flavodoxin WrbA